MEDLDEFDGVEGEEEVDYDFNLDDDLEEGEGSLSWGRCSVAGRMQSID